MVNYEEARVKLTNNQIQKLESAAKTKTGTTLRIRKNLKIRNCLMNYFYQYLQQNVAIQRKIYGWRVVKGITLVISNEDMNIIRITTLGVLIDGVRVLVNYVIKRKRRWISWYVFKNYVLRKYVDKKRSHESWKRCNESWKRI